MIRALSRRQALRLGASAAVMACAPIAGSYAAQLKTPGVYIVEEDAFPNVVVEVATAVPAFVGYTEHAKNGSKSIRNKPRRITSWLEFLNHFGGRPPARFEIEAIADGAAEAPAAALKGKNFKLTPTGGHYLLYDSMRLFFQNGGGPCYVVSVGGYDQELSAGAMQAGIATLVKEQEPTMVVVPDAMRLDEAGARAVQQAMLTHCGDKMRNCVAILDVWNGFQSRHDSDFDPIARFRDGLGVQYLDYATAYYPWLETTIVQANELSYQALGPKKLLRSLITEELGLPETKPALAEADSPEVRAGKQKTIELLETVGALGGPWPSYMDPELKEAEKESRLGQILRNISPFYKALMAAARTHLNRLPPAAAMAGVYTLVDNSRGVWKAPANVSLASVVKPTVQITQDQQEDLNVPLNGKSVNAIRSFIGEGTLVWGARTLDGNSLDWRYIAVRRTAIMLEQSIQLAIKAYVFEPNTVATWTTIKARIGNFLTGIWKRGGLAGAAPEDAFSVHVGLGETMVPEDVLEGLLRVSVLVAMSRPAQFIELTFVQQMQKS